MLDGRQDEDILDMVNKDKVPGHIAIIMDGNGRWALERGLPRKEGHRRGVETVRSVVRNCNELGVKTLTLFAFSTENWRRPVGEINYLMSLPEIYFKTELPELISNNVKVGLLGNKDRLPGKVQKAIDDGMEATKNNKGMILNFALNYGARSEILRAVNRLLEEAKKGAISGVVDKTVFEEYLYTKGLPDPDLLIRTSGELRISNFLLWQLAYSELWFTDVYWPDFSKRHLLNAVYDYQQRKRRYGKI